MENVTREVETEAIVVAPASEIDQLLRLALEKNLSVDTLERLVALKERMDERNAAAQFTEALAAFQAECPPIRKSSTAKITARSGGDYQYTYAELDTIANAIRALLTKHGLSYTWDSDLDAKGMLVCTCHLRHIAGHATFAKFVSPTDSASGMSNQQRHAAALTFAKRQSLIQVLGLTTTDKDTDGASDQKISEEQQHVIEEWIRDSGADRAKFLAYMEAPTVPDILVRNFGKAITSLKAKKRERDNPPAKKAGAS